MSLPAFENISYWGVLTATIYVFILGMFWYGPFFSKIWFKHSRWTPKSIERARKSGMALNFAGTLFQALVGNIIIAALLERFGFTDTLHVVWFSLITWGAFIFPSHLQAYLWEGDHIIYSAINLGNRFVAVLGSSLIYHLAFQ